MSGARPVTAIDRSQLWSESLTPLDRDFGRTAAVRIGAHELAEACSSAT
jgi:hypothetical protein